MALAVAAGNDEDDTNLYVKGLPAYFTQAQVMALFHPYGSVTSARCMRPPAGKTDATALVRMSALQECHSAILGLNGALLGDPPVPPMLVRYHGPMNSPPSDNLYIKGLLRITTEDMLRTAFSVFGRVVSTRVMQPRPPAEDCTALLRMGSVLEATAAMQGLNGQSPPGHQPQVQILVRFADNAKVKEDKTQRRAHQEQQLAQINPQLALSMTPNALSMAPNMMMQQAAGLGYLPLPDYTSLLQASNMLSNSNLLTLEVQYYGGPTAQPSQDLQVKGLPKSSTDEEVKQAFQTCGAVQSVTMIPGGERDASAWIRMGSIQEATQAITVLHGVQMDAGNNAAANPAPTAQAEIHAMQQAMIQSGTVAASPPVADTTNVTTSAVSSTGGDETWSAMTHSSESVSSTGGGESWSATPHSSEAAGGGESWSWSDMMPSSQPISSTEQPPTSTMEPSAASMMQPPASLLVRYHGPSNAPPSDNLYVKGLPSGTSESDVHSYFGSYGNVVSVRIMPGSTDAAALVRMGSIEEATTVIQFLGSAHGPAGTGGMADARASPY